MCNFFFLCTGTPIMNLRHCSTSSFCMYVFFTIKTSDNLRNLFSRENVKHYFECFCEVVGPQAEGVDAWIIQKFPETYRDEEVLKSVPKFTFPCDFDK